MRHALPILTALVLASGCHKAPDTTKALGRHMDAELKGAPDWVTGPCASWEGFKKRQNPICAVGSIAGSSNIGLARDASAGRARNEIGRALETRVAVMLKDYQSTAAAGAPLTDGISDEQYVTEVSRQISTATVNGSEVKTMWTSETGTVWTLVAVDPEKFVGMVDGMQQLRADVREYLHKRAEAELADLDQHTAQ